MKDNLRSYNELLSLKVDRRTVLNLLPDSGWIRNEAGGVRQFGGSIQRYASPVWGSDLIQFDFGDWGLERVIIECGVPQAGQRTDFLKRWTMVRERVSQSLKIGAGTTTDHTAKGFEQRCRWVWGDIDITARATRPWYKWKVVVDLHRRPMAAAGLATGSLEDLFTG